MERIHHFSWVHFIGIGGAGSAPLAEILLARGAKVSGSDSELNRKCARLAAAGAKIFAGHAAENLPPDADCCVYSSAVAYDNPERAAARERGIPELRRGEFLALLTSQYRRCVAISGSHGKSSISAMLVHILLRAGLNPGYLVGAELRDMASAAAGDGDIFVTEVDESDGTHTFFHPEIGVVPNVESDHAWSVGGEERLFANFRRFGEQCRRVIFPAAARTGELFGELPGARDLGVLPERFDIWHGFQALNAQLATAAAAELGVEPGDAVKFLRDFGGVARRMSVHHRSARLVVIEDYAHHPTELANSLRWLREGFPEHHLRVVFQPHRYARLQKYFNELAEVLSRADSVLVAPVFAAWCESGAVGHVELTAAIGARARSVDCDWALAARAALDYTGERPLLIAVIGAGDIDKILKFLPDGGSAAQVGDQDVQPDADDHRAADAE